MTEHHPRCPELGYDALAETCETCAAIRGAVGEAIEPLAHALEQIGWQSPPDSWEPWDDEELTYNGYGHRGQSNYVHTPDESNRGDVHEHGFAQGRWDAARVARAALNAIRALPDEPAKGGANVIPEPKKPGLPKYAYGRWSQKGLSYGDRSNAIADSWAKRYPHDFGPGALSALHLQILTAIRAAVDDAVKPLMEALATDTCRAGFPPQDRWEPHRDCLNTGTEPKCPPCSARAALDAIRAEESGDKDTLTTQVVTFCPADGDPCRRSCDLVCKLSGTATGKIHQVAAIRALPPAAAPQPHGPTACPTCGGIGGKT